MKGDKSRESRTRDRLLLAKELYLHGLEHSRQQGRLNRMIAVHNFHNAIEVVLRSIMLDHGIRPDKKMRVSFEDMMDFVDKFFKQDGVELPRRDDLGVLNQKRNHVQHHGIDVADAEVDLWRECSRDFMKKAYKQYFDEDFDALSRLDWIEDELLKEGLRLAERSYNEGQYAKSLLLSKIVFQWGSYSLLDFLPEEDAGDRTFRSLATKPRNGDQQSGNSLPQETRVTIIAIQHYLHVLTDKVKRSEYFGAILSTGVSLTALKRFEMSTPQASPLGTDPFWQRHAPNDRGQEEAAHEVQDFVVRTLINWQELGLAPHVLPDLQKAAEQVLSEGHSSWADFLKPVRGF